MIRAATVALLAAFLACVVQAQTRPEPGSGDPRLQTIAYRPDQVVLLQGTPGYQITVELNPDEQIESVAIGDSGAWQATANRRGDHLFVKPLQANVSTNMTVVTNVRIYAFDLVPLSGPSSEMAYTLRFRYPGEQPAAPDEDTAALAEGRYRVSGERSLRPSRISDDGRRTYIEWRADSALPAVYALNARGQEELTNGMMRDGVFVIDSVTPRLVFRIDNHFARAVRVRTAARP